MLINIRTYFNTDWVGNASEELDLKLYLKKLHERHQVALFFHQSITYEQIGNNISHGVIW